ncbi:MAG: guanylate kinase [Gammaproteobacteria bacterium]|nr:guanylate kinase [Gammaproteobacteria bacterium]
MNLKRKSGNLFIISAPSGAGKTSLIKALLSNSDDIQLSVSHTTRNKRATEQDGVDYFFISVDEYKDMVDKEQFVEHAKVFDNFYGTSSAHIQQVLDTGKDLILEIDWQGAEQVRLKFPHAISIFILPPSKQELANRLNSRGLDSEDVIQKRMEQAEKEMSHCPNFDYIVVNEQFEQALNELNVIIISQSLTKESQFKNLETLLNDLLAN